MTCEDFWRQMPELPDAASPADHVRECPSCAALLDQHRSVAAGLKQIAATSDTLQPSAALESRLVEVFRNQAGLRPSAPRPYWLAWAAAAAALVLLSFALVRGRQPQQAARPERSDLQLASAASDAAFDTDFVRMPYADSAEAGLSEDDDLVRVEVPRSALLALGVPVPVDADTANVEAVVALGPDGMLQGIQVLQ